MNPQTSSGEGVRALASPDAASGPRKTPATPFKPDTLEARTIRAEVTAKAACERCWELETELRAVDQALTDELAPVYRDGVVIPRYGRIRVLGDRARIAERRFDTLEHEVIR